MTNHVSAGVYWKEIDLSNYAPALSTTQFGAVGTASKGPINVRTQITTTEQLITTFGYPADNFPGIDAAIEYLKEGGNLFYVRPQSAANPATLASTLMACLSGSAVTVNSKDEGTFYNSVNAVVKHTNPRNAADSELADGVLTSFTLDLTKPYLTTSSATWANNLATFTFLKDHDIPNGTEITVTGFAVTAYNGTWVVNSVPTTKTLTFSLNGTGIGAGTTGNVVSVNSQYGAVVVGSVLVHLDAVTCANDVGNDDINDTALTEVGSTIFASGTVNYKTGTVSLTFATPPANNVKVSVTASYYSTFDIVFNKTVGGSTYAMETYKNMSMVKNARGYYADVLAKSRLVQVPTFLDTPLSGIYGFAGGTDGLSGILDSDYIGINLGTSRTGLQLLASPDEIDLNCIAVPDITSNSMTQALVSVGETRRDCMVLIDPPKNLAPLDVVDWADGANSYAAQNAIDSSYAAIYYPWVEVYDSYNSVKRLIAPSGFVAAAFARTDNKADIFYAPAGTQRGKVLGATAVERILGQQERDFLYENRVNPVSDFVATGILLWGQRTSQKAPTALDRISARRTLNYLEKVIVTAAQPLVFEPNNKYTWSRLTAAVQPLLDSMIQKGALAQGKIVCNEHTNTPDAIARNEMVANVFLEITHTAEVITLNFVLLSTGANVDEYIGRQF